MKNQREKIFDFNDISSISADRLFNRKNYFLKIFFLILYNIYFSLFLIFFSIVESRFFRFSKIFCKIYEKRCFKKYNPLANQYIYISFFNDTRRIWNRSRELFHDKSIGIPRRLCMNHNVRGPCSPLLFQVD